MKKEPILPQQNSSSSSSNLRNSGFSKKSHLLKKFLVKKCQKKNVVRKFPILTWLPEYNLTKLLADLIAGLTLGLTTVPSVMGVASVGELPAEYGLYSSIVGSFVYVIFGSAKYITIGPTVTTAIITLSYTKGEPPEFAVLLCFFTGIVTLLMSLFQLGFIVTFISKPVISGFTSAAAISIISTQLKTILGLSYKANGFLEELKLLFKNISQVQLNDSMIGLVSIIALLLLMKIENIFKLFGNFSPKFKKFLWFLATSRNVLVVVVATVIFGSIGDSSIAGFVGDVPSGMPPFKPPPFSFSERDNSTGEVMEFSLGTIFKDKPSALVVIPLIALMEHMTIAKAFAGNNRVDATQELLCVGLANLVGSFFSSVPVTGAFGRTAINYSSGAQTPMGGLVTGAVMILALVLFTPQFFYIPKATISSVTTCAVIFMVDFEILLKIWRSKKMDLIPWIVTFIASLFIALEYGIVIGFGVSTLFLLYYAARPGVTVSKGQTLNGLNFLWVEIDRSVTFPSVDYTRYRIMKGANDPLVVGGKPLPVVFDCQFVQFSDFTAAQGVVDLLKTFRTKDQPLILWKVKASVERLWGSVLLSDDADSKGFVICNSDDDLEGCLQRKGMGKAVDL